MHGEAYGFSGFSLWQGVVIKSYQLCHMRAFAGRISHQEIARAYTSAGQRPRDNAALVAILRELVHILYWQAQGAVHQRFVLFEGV